MSRRFVLRDGKMQEELLDENNVGTGREQVHIQVQAIVQVRDLRERLYKEVCSYTGSYEHISRDDLSDRDFIFKVQEGDDGKLRAVEITKDEVMEMSADTVDLHSMTALLWRDPHRRIREITFGVSVYSDPLIAANNAIQYAYSSDCSILDIIDPSFTAVKTDHVIFPIYAINYKSAMGLKQFRRQQDGSPGSFKSKATVAVFQDIAPQMNQIIDKNLNGLLTRVDKEKEEELVVTIVPKRGSSKAQPLNRYRCKVNGCSFTTSKTWNFTTHENTHTKEVSFQCPGCPARFTTKATMVRHQPICPARTGKAVGKVSFGPRRRTSSIKPKTLPTTSASVSLPPFANLTNSSLKRTNLTDIQGTIKFPPKKLALNPTRSIVEKNPTTTIMTLQSENEDLRREKHVATTTIMTLQSENEDLRREKHVATTTIMTLQSENEDLRREKHVATTTIMTLQSENEDLRREKHVATTTIMTLQSENEDLRREKHVATTTIMTLQSENEDLRREKHVATTTIMTLQSENEDLRREKVQLKRDRALALRKANNSTNNTDYRR
ncbi:uncharacterized protein LOC110845074 [Folsomia candida]|uniref:Zonadhesin n=1 Tax=Folsomia candida TaxID=158441 RepID=A0A226EU60_FOLCA|nr:uncharacterized protein LOC110845074 [Folsomia candida]OXA61132.1 Zonadhesin [Folsomia candida]